MWVCGWQGLFVSQKLLIASPDYSEILHKYSLAPDNKHRGVRDTQILMLFTVFDFSVSIFQSRFDYLYFDMSATTASA